MASLYKKPITVTDPKTGEKIKSRSHLTAMNAKVDVRLERRCFPSEEFELFLEAAGQGPRLRKIPGKDRRMLYIAGTLAKENSALKATKLRQLARKRTAGNAKAPPGFEPGMADLQSASPSPQLLVGRNISVNNSESLAFCLAHLQQKSPDLALLVKRWDSLPGAVRAGIVAMVKAASSKEAP